MNKKLCLIALAIISAGTISCVSKSKHNEAINQYEEQLKAKDTEIKQRSDTLSQKEGSVKDLEQKLVSLSKDKGQLKSNIEELNKALAEMKLRREQEQKTIQEYRDLTAKFKSLTDSGALSVRIENGKMMVSLGSDVLFNSGSANLNEEAKKTLTEVAKRLAEIPDKNYQVEGHTDNVPIKTAMFPSNWELASTRSLSVLRTLIEGGLDASRISAASFGETRAVALNDTVEGRAKNRRIEIVIIPNLAQLPGYQELQKLSK
jgi:chemotaxis protein MotB